jgi:hypothetical protein
MKNRKREICTSGSVRDEDGQPPHLLGRRQFLHLAAGAATKQPISLAASSIQLRLLSKIKLPRARKESDGSR